MSNFGIHQHNVKTGSQVWAYAGINFRIIIKEKRV
nr:MAG TPA: hypothetical protein [Bacteriophage sp.]